MTHDLYCMQPLSVKLSLSDISLCFLSGTTTKMQTLHTADVTSIDGLNLVFRATTVKSRIFWSVVTVATTAWLLAVVTCLALKYNSHTTNAIIRVRVH